MSEWVSECIYISSIFVCSLLPLLLLYIFRSFTLPYEKKIVFIYSSYLRVVVVAVVVTVSYRISGFLVHFMLQMWLRYVRIFPVHFIWFILYECVCVCLCASLRICLNLKQKRHQHRHCKYNAYMQGTKNTKLIFSPRFDLTTRRQHELDASISCWSLSFYCDLASVLPYTWCDCVFLFHRCLFVCSMRFDFGWFDWLFGWSEH